MVPAAVHGQVADFFSCPFHHLTQYMELLKQIVDIYLLNFMYSQQSLVQFYWKQMFICHKHVPYVNSKCSPTWGHRTIDYLMSWKVYLF